MTSSSALEKIRVLDLTRVLAGPWCTQVLGDLGADIIKVEHPTKGDESRYWGEDYFNCTNRNKRSIAIDFSVAEGADLVRELAATSDVFVENYRTGQLRRYGLDYDSIRKVNPSIVYCSITGFGQTGPRDGEAGYDLLVQGLGGMMTLNARKGDGQSAQRIKLPIIDITTGLYAAIAILAALNARHETGEGQYCELSLLECEMSLLSYHAQSYLRCGREPQYSDDRHPFIAPYQIFMCKDREIIVACGNDGQFRMLATVIGLPALSNDPRFKTNESRVANLTKMTQILEGIFRKEDAVVWIKKCVSAGVPAGPVNSLAEVFTDPQVVARQTVEEFASNDVTKRIQFVRSPIRLSRTPVQYRWRPPELGEHSRDLREELRGECDSDPKDRLC